MNKIYIGNTEVANVGSSSGNSLECFEVTENGLFFVDSSLNIGVSIDSNGLHAPNLVEFNEIS